MIDWNRIAELRDEIGADDFGEVVEIFLEEVDDKIAELRDLTDKSDLESVMHFLKGSALNLGFSAFSDLCQQGETAARMGDGENIDLTAVIACYDTSKAEFLSALNKLDAA
ncbi:Hpt domain-containing protein [Roseovarius aestuarii]|uniref:Hpt domain protein n=1 Tax=Roseovarius aestuarii TaxID=475083 RepID=A0A1X7BQW2_9RHOB|nr:Hpt domain-containing protein [Roseovarius aestuarii]SMC11985.1 Hpt domain protein [Roseovarius aestuarii]